MSGNYFLHVDIDAFFASVEQLDNPELRGKPVIVGGLPGERRSVVSTASYEARAYGVHSAMSVAEAYRLCPNGVFMHGRMKRYHELSAKIMDIFRTYSPDMEQMSVDEAFIDLTGTERLFGKPSETAMKLKREVQKKIGLTVSCGLASTKYIAKLASEINKPDGFFEVAHGDEERFMLSLPLKKIWGIGPTTLSRINAAGMHTVKDIHEKSKNLLMTLFGESTGSFLYNVSHGNEVDAFTKEAQSHSISAETTFAYDITDAYTAETALMELCHTVMFRLLKEGFTSKTALVKLRYDDFTTVSIRETRTSEITSTDELYERVCTLFEKKYEAGRGIRLLGVGAEKITALDAPRQQELFDFGEKKKQAVEKAILNLSQKHPDVKVYKARLLKKTKLLVFALLASFFMTHGNHAYAKTDATASGAGAIVTDEAERDTRADTTKESVFDFELGNNNVEFFASGCWESSIVQTTATSFGFGNPFALSFGIPVLKQKVDLSLLFTINKSWFFSADFADSFAKNTIAAGYRGNGIVKEAMIANRGIIFPSFYSVSEFDRNIDGGKNQAPGMSLHLADGKWRFNAAIRYDMLAEHNATFYGTNSVSTISISPAAWQRGQLFVLPSSEDVSAIANIFVESDDGTHTDSNAHTYKRLAPSQYLLLPARSMIVISSDAQSGIKNGKLPRVLITFSSRTRENIKDELGKYDDTVPSDDDLAAFFLARIQKYFSGTDLERYAYAPHAENHYGLFTTIAGDDALIIQSPDGFSPFACAHRYDCGITTATDASVIFARTKQTASSYSAAIAERNIDFVAEDFFLTTHTFVDMYSAHNASNDMRSPASRYPLANSAPGFYLGYDEATDMQLVLRTYTPVTRFDIGTDVSAGSVTVYKNNIIDGGATYDEETGCVTLSTAVSDTDKIYITWYEDSSSINDGAIATAAGFSYDFFPGFFADISFSSRWALGVRNKFADAASSRTGFVSLATGARYTNGGFSAANATLASVENKNVTGTYRVLGMDDEKSSTFYLASTSGRLLPDGFEPVLTDRAGNPPPELKKEKYKAPGSVLGRRERNVSGYVIPLSCSSLKGADGWTAVSINLSGGSLLSSGTTFSIGLKTTDMSPDCIVYLQLGIDASQDVDVRDEAKNKIPTWKISLENSSSPNTLRDVVAPLYLDSAHADSWQAVTVALTDYDRSRLTKHHDARIIVVNEGTGPTTSGSLAIGPYETAVQTVFTRVYDNNMTVAARQEVALDVPNASKFNTGTNYAALVTWKNDAPSAPASEKRCLTLAKYFDEVDIAPYKTLNMYFKYSGETAFIGSTTTDEKPITFALDADATSIDDEGRTAVKFEIPPKYSALFADNAYHLLTINLADKKVFIDNNEIATAQMQINTSVIPTRLKMEIDTAANGKTYKKGSFTFDELHLDGSSVYGMFANVTKVSYKKDGVVLASKNGFPIVENVSLAARAKEEGTVSPSSRSFVATADASANATIASIAVATDASFSSAEKGALATAGYSVRTTTPLFSVISFSDAYRYDHASSSTEYADAFSLAFDALHVPLSLSFATRASSSMWSSNQKLEATIASSFGKNTWKAEVHAKSQIAQKIKQRTSFDAHTIAHGWLSSVRLAYSNGASTANSRTSTNEIQASVLLPFSSFNPKIVFKTDGSYAAASHIVFADATTFLSSFPFKIGRHTFAVEWEKKGGGSEIVSAGGNYLSDYEKLFSAWKKRSWYFYAFPFYDLISENLAKAVLKDTSLTAQLSDSLYYATRYSVSWKRQLSASLLDFFAPSSMQLALERDIRTAKNKSDVYQIKTTLVTTAFNILGSQSVMSTFKWFEFDEYTTSIAGAIKIPRSHPAHTTFALSLYTQQNFYLNDFDTLKTGIEFTWETDGDWSTQTTAIWKRKGKISPLANLVAFIWKKYDKTGADITRTMSFDAMISSRNKKLHQSYTFANTMEMKLLSYTTISCGATLAYASVTNEAMRLSLALSLGAKLEF